MTNSPKPDFLFSSERLGFRNWSSSDFYSLAEINADPEVMKYFPHVSSKEVTLAFINRMEKHFQAKGYCYFAVETLTDQEFVGFIGLAEQNFESDFTPCIDIGWRLAQRHWGKGYATEGAKRCLRFGFEDIGLKTIYSMAPKINTNSIHVMNKIGMVHVKTFDHPLLVDYENLKECELYEAHNLSGFGIQ